MIDFTIGAIPASRKDPDQYKTCCPFCLDKTGKADTKFKLEFNTRKNIFHCWRCGSKGALNQNELTLLNKTDSSNEKFFDKLKTRIEKVGSFDEDLVDNLDLEQFSYRLTKKGTPLAYNYISGRGVLDSEIKKFRLRVGKSFKEDDKTISRWRGRIIFPFFKDGNVVFAVGRSYTGKKPKYLNSYGAKSEIVYNIDNVKDECILCEGIISSIAAERYSGVPGISILGKQSPTIEISYSGYKKFDYSAQLALIASRCSKVNICLDGGVDPKMVDAISTGLLNQNPSIKLWKVELPLDKDPDDLKQDFLSFFNDKKLIKRYGSFKQI